MKFDKEKWKEQANMPLGLKRFHVINKCGDRKTLPLNYVVETCLRPSKGDKTVPVWILHLRNIEHGYDLEGWRMEVTATHYYLVGCQPTYLSDVILINA